MSHLSTADIARMADVLRFAITGLESDARMPVPACVADRQVAAVFGPDAFRSAVHPGDGMLALRRTSADRCAQVLFVHNISDEQQGFLPERYFDTPAGDTGPLMFLTGETTTVDTGCGLRCLLAPLGFVWIGYFTSL